MNGIIGKYHVSKNLFDATWESGSIGNAGGNLNDTNAIRTVGFIACEAEKLYSFSPELDVTETWVNYYDNNGGISRFKITDGTFTTPQGCTRLRFRLSRTDIGVTPVPQPLPMLNVGTPLPYEPYDTEVWHDIPYTRLETTTDTITALPKTIYTDTTSIPSANLLNPESTVELDGVTHYGQSFPAGTYYIYNGAEDSVQNYITYSDDFESSIYALNGGSEAFFTATNTLILFVTNRDVLRASMVAKSSEAVTFTPYVGDYTIKGNMSQTGTPTPTTPITPQECGDMTENYFDIQNYVANITTHNCTVSVAANGVKITATGSDAYAGEAYKLPDRANAADRAAAIPATENTTYVLSADVDSFRDCYISYLDSSYDAINANYTAIGVNVPAKFTTPAGTAYIALRFGSTSLSSGQSKTFANITLNKNGKYKLPIVSGGVTTNVYLNEPLRKIGDYADTITTDGTMTRVIKTYKITGQENWGVHGSVASWFYVDNIIYPIISTDSTLTSPTITSHFKVRAYAYAVGISNGECTFGHPSGVLSQFRTILKNTDYTTVEDFTNWLKYQYNNGNPVTIWYASDSSTTETITAPSIPTTSGGQTFDVGTTLKPSEVDLTYHGWHEYEVQKYSRTENLFDKANDIDNFYVRASDGVYKKSTGNSYSAIIPCVAGTAYTITTISKTLRVGFYATKPIDGTSCIESFNNNNSSYTSRSVTYTASTNATYMAIYAYQDGDEYSDGKTLDDIYGVLMVNTGSTAKPYQPYLDWE